MATFLVESCRLLELAPFPTEFCSLNDDSYIVEDLINPRNNLGAQVKLTDSHLEHFRAFPLETHSVLAKGSHCAGVPLATTYLYEA